MELVEGSNIKMPKEPVVKKISAFLSYVVLTGTAI